MCEAETASAPVDALARAALAREGLTDEVSEIEVSYLPLAPGSRRVRLEGVALDRPRVGWVVARVTLGWQGNAHTGTGEGEAGAPGDLRVAAQATLRGLESVLGGEVRFELVGVKPLRVFDHDLVAALVRCPQAPDRRLIGMALVADDPARAAVAAVLNGTNRLLGNNLTSVDERVAK